MNETSRGRVPENSAIVVAHPDDEVLWFGSILEAVDRVIFCYSDAPGNPRLSEARRRLKHEYPLPNAIFLDLPESGALNTANWKAPEDSPYGLVLHGSGAVRRLYETNHAALRHALEPHLADITDVYTHNPWGEYGNEEHVQVSHAVSELSGLQGFRCWHSCYYSRKTQCLTKRYGVAGVVTVAMSADSQRLATQLANLYLDLDCWTWYDDYERYSSERFFRLKRSSSGDATVVRSALNEVRPNRGFRFFLEKSCDSGSLREYSHYAVPVLATRLTSDDADIGMLTTRNSTGTRFRLDEPAALVCALCDGRRSVEEIGIAISDAYGYTREREPEGFYETFVKLRDLGILRLSFAPLTDRPLTSRTVVYDPSADMR